MSRRNGPDHDAPVTGGSFEPVRPAAQENPPSEPPIPSGVADEEPPIPAREDTQPIAIPAPPGTGGEWGDARADDGSEPPPGDVAALPRFGGGSWVGLAIAGGLVLLVIVFFAVNATVASNAEERAADEARAALGVPVDVRLDRFPVGIRLLAGTPIDARLTARDVPLEGSDARLSRLEIDARDVVLERGGDGAIRAERATFLAELDADNVQQLLGIVGRLPLTDIELANGVARLSVAGFRLIDATADVAGGQVVFTITSPLGSLDFLGALTSIPLQLGELPLGFRIDEVEIGRGVLRVRGSAVDLILEAQPG